MVVNFSDVFFQTNGFKETLAICYNSAVGGFSEIFNTFKIRVFFHLQEFRKTSNKIKAIVISKLFDAT